jgi:hypothetical protein
LWRTSGADRETTGGSSIAPVVVQAAFSHSEVHQRFHRTQQNWPRFLPAYAFKGEAAKELADQKRPKGELK